MRCKGEDQLCSDFYDSLLHEIAPGGSIEVIVQGLILGFGPWVQPDGPEVDYICVPFIKAKIKILFDSKAFSINETIFLSTAKEIAGRDD